MSKTIEERLDALLYEQDEAVIHADFSFSASRSTQGAPIIADWNAAIKAMEAVVPDLYYSYEVRRPSPDGGWSQEMAERAAAFRDALAAMKGETDGSS